MVDRKEIEMLAKMQKNVGQNTIDSEEKNDLWAYMDEGEYIIRLYYEDVIEHGVESRKYYRTVFTHKTYINNEYRMFECEGDDCFMCKHRQSLRSAGDTEYWKYGWKEEAIVKAHIYSLRGAVKKNQYYEENRLKFLILNNKMKHRLQKWVNSLKMEEMCEAFLNEGERTGVKLVVESRNLDISFAEKKYILPQLKADVPSLDEVYVNFKTIPSEADKMYIEENVGYKIKQLSGDTIREKTENTVDKKPQNAHLTKKDEAQSKPIHTEKAVRNTSVNKKCPHAGSSDLEFGSHPTPDKIDQRCLICSIEDDCIIATEKS